MMQAGRRKVVEVPLGQLDDLQARIRAGKVRELSREMEDAVDASFMVRVEDLHQISGAIEEARQLAEQLPELRQRYALEIHSTCAGAIISPRLVARHKDVNGLVGIRNPRDELVKMSKEGDKGLYQQLKIVYVVGFGGVGKTTLDKEVCDTIKV